MLLLKIIVPAAKLKFKDKTLAAKFSDGFTRNNVAKACIFTESFLHIFQQTKFLGHLMSVYLIKKIRKD